MKRPAAGGTAAERAAAALDYKARRVPAWQVSTVGLLSALWAELLDSPSTAEHPLVQSICPALRQVPPEVRRAVELHRANAAG